MPLITFILSLFFSYPISEAPVYEKPSDNPVAETGRTNTGDNPDYIIITEMATP